jgi:hypothetical protein
MTPAQQNKFLTALAGGSTTSEAATAAGLGSSSFYALRKRDADFAEAWRLALEDSTDVLEKEARRRAVDGVQEPVIYQGAQTPVWEYDENGQPVLGTDERPVQARNADGSLKYLTITKYSDSLLSLLLKGRRKDVFADRTELTGANGVDINATKQRSIAESLLATWAARAAHKDLA